MAQSGAVPFLDTFGKCPFAENVRRAMEACTVVVKIEILAC